MRARRGRYLLGRGGYPLSHLCRGGVGLQSGLLCAFSGVFSMMMRVWMCIPSTSIVVHMPRAFSHCPARPYAWRGRDVRPISSRRITYRRITYRRIISENHLGAPPRRWPTCMRRRRATRRQFASVRSDRSHCPSRMSARTPTTQPCTLVMDDQLMNHINHDGAPSARR